MTGLLPPLIPVTAGPHGIISKLSEDDGATSAALLRLLAFPRPRGNRSRGFRQGTRSVRSRAVPTTAKKLYRARNTPRSIVPAVRHTQLDRHRPQM